VLWGVALLRSPIFRLPVLFLVRRLLVSAIFCGTIAGKVVSFGTGSAFLFVQEKNKEIAMYKTAGLKYFLIRLEHKKIQDEINWG
jgi:hypothetical protein